MSEQTEMGVKRIEMKNERMAFDIGVQAGLAGGVEKLEKLPKHLKETPGFALALATLIAHANENTANQIQRNLTYLSKQGVNLEDYKSITVETTAGGDMCFHCSILGDDNASADS